jgi:hypothetical protein
MEKIVDGTIGLVRNSIRKIAAFRQQIELLAVIHTEFGEIDVRSCFIICISFDSLFGLVEDSLV